VCYEETLREGVNLFRDRFRKRETTAKEGARKHGKKLEKALILKQRKLHERAPGPVRK